MPRARNRPAAHNRHKKILKLAKGNIGGRHRLYRSARETVEKGLKYAYRDRRNRKRDFRRLWIIRINAACRLHGLNYSLFMHNLKLKGLLFNRKILADIAVQNPQAFTDLVKSIQ